jgi:hypothetical protein
MKPNIFVYKNLKNEDHFTNSLGYLLNLFPKELGDRFIAKLATSSGKSANYLGKFKKAEFTGFNFQNEDSTSKPDLIINTDKFKIFFEIKLTAPLSNSQLERHLSDVKKSKGKLVLISNINTKISEKILLEKDYLKPSNNEHFLWADFVQIFNYKFRKNNLGELLFTDFRHSMKLNGIDERRIVGANDNLYVGGSKAQKIILDKLGSILKEIGFKVWSLPQDHTIRVYPLKMKIRPLLNPRFYPTGEWLDEDLIQECLIIFCHVDAKDRKGVSGLRKLDDLKNDFSNLRIYEDTLYADSHYYYRYIIYIPLNFMKIQNSFDLNWKYLREVWQEIYKILAK